MDSSREPAATTCSFTFPPSRRTVTSTLEEGSEVEFEVKQGPKGLQAEDVLKV
jgi:hypothetical protein